MITKNESQLIWLIKQPELVGKNDDGALALWYDEIYKYSDTHWPTIHSNLLELVLKVILAIEPFALNQRIAHILNESLPSKDWFKTEKEYNDFDTIRAQIREMCNYLRFRTVVDLKSIGWQEFDPEWK